MWDPELLRLWKSVTVIIVMKKSLSKMAVKKIFIVPRILAAQKKYVFFESVASLRPATIQNWIIL